MAQTTSTQMIVPEVYGDMAQAEFLGAVKVLTSGAVVFQNTLEGVPGSTINFPKWTALGELDDLTEGTALSTTQMGTANSTATIKEAGKAVEITDKARLVGLGDPEAEARRQFGVLAARKLDADLIAQAAADETAAGGSTPLSYDSATGKTVLTWAELVLAIAKFGDEWDPADFAGIFINSAQHAELLADANFISADKLGAAATILRGQVGVIGGVPVFVTDRVTAKKVLIIKRNALGALYKQRPLVESDRDILARSTVITTTMHYAVKRLNDRGVCVLTLAAS